MAKTNEKNTPPINKRIRNQGQNEKNWICFGCFLSIKWEAKGNAICISFRLIFAETMFKYFYIRPSSSLECEAKILKLSENFYLISDWSLITKCFGAVCAAGAFSNDAFGSWTTTTRRGSGSRFTSHIVNKFTDQRRSHVKWNPAFNRSKKTTANIFTWDRVLSGKSICWL